MKIPDWYVLLLLTLAAFRTWRLLAEDDILDRPRRYVTRLGPKWEKEGDPVPNEYRIRLGAFIDCCWCLGFWSALAWWGAWQVWPHGVEVAAVPLALSALIPLIERITSAE
jgi:hypothetical protein